MAATLIYDGECPLCLGAVEWVRRRARDGALDYMACQSSERAERFPHIATETCMEAMQLVLEDGAVHAGDRALPHLFLRLRRWRWMALLFRIPGVSLLSPPAYGFVAKHRRMISILVARKNSPRNAGIE